MVDDIVSTVHPIDGLAVSNDVLVGVDLNKEAMFVANEAGFDVCDLELGWAGGFGSPIHGLSETVQPAG